MKYIIAAIIALIIVIIGWTFYQNHYLEFTWTEIKYDQVLTQEDKGNGYIVYYYQPTCQYCLEFKPFLTDWAKDYAKKYPIYAVDLSKEENKDGWMDWDAYHAANDIIIGTVDSTTGENVYNDGKTQAEIDELYPSDTYTIEQASDGSSNLVAYPTPATSVDQIKSVEDITVSGTPTMLYVKDGQVLKYGTGVEELKLIIGQLK